MPTRPLRLNLFNPHPLLLFLLFSISRFLPFFLSPAKSGGIPSYVKSAAFEKDLGFIVGGSFFPQGFTSLSSALIGGAKFLYSFHFSAGLSLSAETIPGRNSCYEVPP